MHLERAFAHILDCGGMRRATLRGRQNLSKRFKLTAAFHNLSQLMRKLFGMGTPRQCEAMAQSAFRAFLKAWALWLLAIVPKVTDLGREAVRKNGCSTEPVRPLEMAA